MILKIAMVVWLLLSLVGCDKYVAVPKMVGCPQFELIDIPEKVFVSIETLGTATVVHDGNMSKKMSTIHKNLSDSGFGGDHAYKDASLIPNDILYEIMNYIGYLLIQVNDYNRKYNAENNSTKIDGKK